MPKIIMDRGPLEPRIYEEPTPRKAAMRAEQLARLHGTTYTRDRDGDFFVDASDYYTDKEST